jgi:DNA mismatch repair protein MutS
MSKSGTTPLMRQYNDIKGKYPGTILLFRVGDFYETFSDDAVTISRELGITLTKRNNGGDQTPLAGFPFHALDSYLPKLIRRGFRVAVCEQTQDPEEAKAQKKIVEREVTEIVTPGTALSDKLLDHKRNNYLVSVFKQGTTWAIAYADVSTAEFYLAQTDYNEHLQLVSSLQPAELLLPKKWKSDPDKAYSQFNVTWVDDWIFEGDFAYKLLTDHFKTHSLKGFGVDELAIAQVAAGALLHYVSETQKGAMGNLRKLRPFEPAGTMMLDPATKRNLELTASMSEGGTDGTLISILDETCTAMGGRLLRRRIHAPQRNIHEIKRRLESVESLLKQHTIRGEIRSELDHMGDLERLISRIALGRCSARDVVQLKLSIQQLPKLKILINGIQDPVVSDINKRIRLLIDVQERIQKALIDEPPASIRDGGMIRDGYSPELDELRDITKNGKKYVARIQQDLIKSTGISSLKLGYNRVFGYYIEVTKLHQSKVPDTFIRKQTLVNAERYITPELKEIEEKILSAEEKISSLEESIFHELRIFVAEHTEQIQELAAAIAELDVLQSLAETAFRNKYVKPVVNEGDVISIKAGRHPVVERTLPPGEPFIPNDVELNNRDQQIIIITGPNMAGKSIILRQTGLIVLMAQIGSFVPADAAEIGIVDKIFTRVGASDNLAAGESTFLVEMNEAANILNNATPKSLILLDEVGRGTSTFDGLSIAWSLAEYLHNSPDVAAKTLFATHYHELNELESRYPRIKNFNVLVREFDGKVVFLRKLVKGGADHSYGIQVASMAGLPEAVIARARQILTNLESHTLEVDAADSSDALGVVKAARQKGAVNKALETIPTQETLPQLSLFQMNMDPRQEMIFNKLRAMDPDRMTPIEALMLLADLRRLLS